MDSLDELLENRPVRCSKCRGSLVYHGRNSYQCKLCGNIEYDDLGKVKSYLDKNGPTPIPKLSAETGVSSAKLSKFLRTGRVEIPEGSDVYINCKKCGCEIRYGKYCPDCARKIKSEFSDMFIGDLSVGEKPEKRGEMHFATRGGNR